MSEPAKIEENSEAAKELLRQSPWALLSKFSQQDHVPPPGRGLAAKHAMEAWAGRLGDSADERKMDSWLPGLAGTITPTPPAHPRGKEKEWGRVGDKTLQSRAFEVSYALAFPDPVYCYIVKKIVLLGPYKGAQPEHEYLVFPCSALQILSVVFMATKFKASSPPSPLSKLTLSTPPS